MFLKTMLVNFIEKKEKKSGAIFDFLAWVGGSWVVGRASCVIAHASSHARRRHRTCFTRPNLVPTQICPGSILLAKICEQIFLAIVAKEIIEKKLCQKITYKYCKDRKNNKSNKNQDLEKKRSLEGARNVRKYRKNRKSNKDFSC